MTIGQRIRDRRLELNLDPKDIAEKIEKSLSTYYRYETGEIEKLTISKMCEIAEILEVSPAYLLLGSESDYKNAPENKYNIISFSFKLKDLMNANRLTKEQLVFDLLNDYNIKITTKDINDWENGIKSPDIASFVALSEYFKVSVDFLIGKSKVTVDYSNKTKAKESSREYNKEKFMVKNLKNILNNSEYSVEKMAELTEIDVNTLSKYYKGELSEIDPIHIKKIANTLEISVIDIMYERNAGPIVEKLSQLDAVQLYDVEEYINKLLSK